MARSRYVPRRSALWGQSRRSMGALLGALTPTQLDEANDTLLELSQRLTAQYAELRKAKAAGIDESLVGQAFSAHSQLLTELNDLSAELPGIEASRYEDWQAAVDTLSSRVGLFEDETIAALRAGGRRRTAVVVLSTLGAIALAGTIAGLVWYGTQPGAVLAAKRWRKHR